MDKQITELARQLGELLKQQGLKIVTAESCTGGGLAQAITDISGSSAWFDRGFITYSNQSKIDMLHVKKATLEAYGAVSEQVALEMVSGAIKHSEADISISVTGIAGPSGGSAHKPVGTVYIAFEMKGKHRHCMMQVFVGDRKCIRELAIKKALLICINECIQKPPL